LKISELSNEVLKELHDKIRDALATLADGDSLPPELASRRDDLEQEMKNREILFNPLVW
jgi:hypothetical protein